MWRLYKLCDMALLIEVEDELHNMDKALHLLAGHGHASGGLSSWIMFLM